MEILILIGALLALDVAANFFGADSREARQLPAKGEAMAELEREAARVTAIRF